MIKYLLLLFFFLILPNDVFSEEDLKIELQNYNNKLRLCLINTDVVDILVNKRFAFGPSSGVSEVTFEFLDKEGKKYPFRTTIDQNPASEKDIIVLSMRNIIGREFENKDLIQFYILEPGKYKVRVKYKNKNEHLANKGVYNKSLISDWVVYQVTEIDMINIYGENWEEIRQDYFRKKKAVKDRYEKYLNEAH